jgi:DNA end-binding protein Ku
VQIPVRLAAAERSNDIAFHQVDRRDLARIRYERVNEETGEKVEWADITKGYQLDDGTIVPIEEEDIEKANVEATHTIDIQDFVDRGAIPPEYFQKPYFVLPDRSAKPYAVLREAMKQKNTVAIALVVIRTRQHLAALIAEGDALLLEILRFPEELREVDEIADELPPESGASSKEIDLAEQLIDSRAASWDPDRYHDTFRSELLKAIEHKAKTGKLPKAKKKAAGKTKVTDLVTLLKKSVEAA